jgi:hypothetical protein
MHLQLMWCRSGLSGEGGTEVVRLSVQKSLAVGVIPGDGTEVRRGSKYKQGEGRGGKEMDRCPLTLPPLQSALS